MTQEYDLLFELYAKGHRVIIDSIGTSTDCMGLMADRLERMAINMSTINRTLVQTAATIHTMTTILEQILEILATTKGDDDGKTTNASRESGPGAEDARVGTPKPAAPANTDNAGEPRRDHGPAPA